MKVVPTLLYFIVFTVFIVFRVFTVFYNSKYFKDLEEEPPKSWEAGLGRSAVFCEHRSVIYQPSLAYAPPL